MTFLRSLRTGIGITMFISTVVILTMPVVYRILPRGVMPNITSQPQTTPTTIEPNGLFSRLLGETERHTILEIFNELLHTCTFNNITMFLYAGSMIGAYRHHGMIPWDHDIDVIINGSQKQLAWDAISNTGLYLRNFSQTIWKLYKSTDQDFPFIDIYFFTENSTHIYDENFDTSFWHPKELVFPLQMRPFETEFAPVPCNVVEYIKRCYSDPIDQCIYQIISDEEMEERIAPCSTLYDRYDFVNRTSVGNGVVLEQLLHGQIKKQVFEFPEFC